MSQVNIPRFSAQSVKLLSAYLFPPALSPIPSEYLSTPLQHRHRFLSISAQDPIDYLCWPTPDSPSIIEHLFSISKSSLELNQIQEQVVYTIDADHLLARVPISLDNCHIQLLFLFDPEDITIPWKYHDVRLQPIPSDAYPSVDEAIQLLQARQESVTNMDNVYPENADAFWEGYESSPPSSPERMLAQHSSGNDKIHEERAERDYWARYSDMQGTY